MESKRVQFSDLYDRFIRSFLPTPAPPLFSVVRDTMRFTRRAATGVALLVVGVLAVEEAVATVGGGGNALIAAVAPEEEDGGFRRG